MPAQTVIKFRRDTAANWASTNPTLGAGEAGLETDTRLVKYGNGTTAWNSLEYQKTGVVAGGSTGQFLTKVDGTDFNTTWSSSAPTAGYTSVVKHEVKLGEAIAKGQAVYVSSASGTNMIVSKASNASEATSSKTMGLLETGGATNAFVNVVTEGLLAGLNTSTATAGDPVWLGTAGDLIYGLASKPSAPAHLVFIGIVTRAHASQGEIFVKVQNGFELQELHNVAISGLATGNVLQYNGSLWVNAELDALPTQTGQTGKYLTTNGTDASWATIDLSSKLSATITDPATGQIIQYNGTAWVNAAAAETGISGFLLMGA